MVWDIPSIQENAEDQQAQTPVHHQSHGDAAEDALAALEAQQGREVMPQDDTSLMKKFET